MDANGTGHHLFLGKPDWGRCSLEEQGAPTLASFWSSSPPEEDAGNLFWDSERDEVTLQPLAFQFVPAPRDRAPDPEDRRGASCDRFQNWYWIGQSGTEVLVNSSGTGKTTRFWPLDPGRPCGPAGGRNDFAPTMQDTLPAPKSLGGLTVTEDHYLVVGMGAPKGLLVFDLYAGGPPRIMLWPAAVPFAPYDMAPAPGGGVWILDRDNKCFWALDRHFDVITQDQEQTTTREAREDDFQPVEGSRRRTPRKTFPAGVSLEAASSVAASEPVAIEAVRDTTVLILDRNGGTGFSRIYLYDNGRQIGDPVSVESMSELIEEQKQRDFTLIGHDLAFVPRHDDREDHVYIAEHKGNQSFAFTLERKVGGMSLKPLAEYFPMRQFGGKGIVACGTQVHYDFGDGWVPLAEQRRPRYAPEATFYTPLAEGPLDGKEPDCVWHRLMIDAVVPSGTAVTIWSRAANDEGELQRTAWQQEPEPRRRANGSEQPFASTTAAGGYGTWEALFQRARGQYLQLRITLTGNERVTPRLRALRVYYPRFSYLSHYLPAVYREDSLSASFLDRYLANIEGCYTALEDRIASVQALFDQRSAPPEALEWLCGWFGILADPKWDESRQRLFIKHAMDFFQYRGTIPGLKMALRLAIDTCTEDAIFTDYVQPEPAVVAGKGYGGPSGLMQTAPETSNRAKLDPIRIVEQYRTRRTPGIVLGDPTESSGPRWISPERRWRPKEGGAALLQRYRQAVPSATAFPVLDPGGDETTAWQRFAQDTLGFVPSAVADESKRWQAFLVRRHPPDIAALNSTYKTSYATFGDVPLPKDMPTGDSESADWTAFVQGTASAAVSRLLWQNFLARRYRSVSALNSRYGTHWTSFDAVSLPDELPRDGEPLGDWYQFESVVMAMRRTAHRFIVMLPLPKTETPYSAEHQQRLDLARRIVDLEKPSHTVFDVKFYWAMFRIGEARLGYDTLLGKGSRLTEFMRPAVLGQGHLGESYIDSVRPHFLPGRFPADCGRVDA